MTKKGAKRVGWIFLVYNPQLKFNYHIRIMNEIYKLVHGK